MSGFFLFNSKQIFYTRVFTFTLIVVIMLVFTKCTIWNYENIAVTVQWNIENDINDNGTDCYFIYCNEFLQPVIEEINEFKDYSIKTEKNYLQPFLLYPMEGGLLKDHTYGCIYPYSTVMTQKDGFTAYVLYNLCIGCTDNNTEAIKRYLLSFNWPQFMEYIAEVENPWLLDEEYIIKKIASGTFRKSDIKYK